MYTHATCRISRVTTRHDRVITRHGDLNRVASRRMKTSLVRLPPESKVTTSSLSESPFKPTRARSPGIAGRRRPSRRVRHARVRVLHHSHTYMYFSSPRATAPPSRSASSSAPSSSVILRSRRLRGFGLVSAIVVTFIIGAAVRRAAFDARVTTRENDGEIWCDISRACVYATAVVAVVHARRTRVVDFPTRWGHATPRASSSPREPPSPSPPPTTTTTRDGAADDDARDTIAFDTHSTRRTSTINDTTRVERCRDDPRAKGDPTPRSSSRGALDRTNDTTFLSSKIHRIEHPLHALGARDIAPRVDAITRSRIPMEYVHIAHTCARHAY